MELSVTMLPSTSESLRFISETSCSILFILEELWIFLGLIGRCLLDDVLGRTDREPVSAVWCLVSGGCTGRTEAHQRRS